MYAFQRYYSQEKRYPTIYYIAALSALLIVSFLLVHQQPRYSLSVTSSGSRSSRCDPHTLPGVLDLPEDFDTFPGALRTVWRPFENSSGCPAQLFVQGIGTAPKTAKTLPEELHGRTILLIGDSIDRNNVAYSCNLLNGTYTTIQPDNPRGLWPQANITLDPATTSWLPNDYSHRSFPSMCEIASIDLVLLNVFHFGLDEEEYFGWKDQWGPPGNSQDRIKEIALPLVERLGRRIDIIEFSSGLWDLARFGRMDDQKLTADSEKTQRHLTYSRLAWYSGRYSRMLSLLTATFQDINERLAVPSRWDSQPSPPLFLSRKLHISADDEAGSFQQWWQVAGGGKDGNKHTFYFPSWRVNEINNAMQAALDAQQSQVWSMDTWGDKLFGMELYEPGNVHPHYAATTLWLEQMLYRLWRHPI